MSVGQIHDLGYKRYAGARRSVDSRWTVIMRHQLASAWKTWWRYKVWLAAAVIATAIAAGFLYLTSDRMIRMLTSAGGRDIGLADGILPISTEWYCKIGLIVSLTISSTVVAGDVQSGAFTFYFARSVRPRDYVLGKLTGLALLLAPIMLLGPVLLAALRLGLSDNLDHLLTLLPNLPKALAVGALGTLLYSAVPLGFSAVIANRRYAMALWAAYYIIVGNMLAGLGYVVSPTIGAFDPPTALKTIGYALFDVHLSGRDAAVPVWAAVVSISAYVGVAIAVVAWRVRNAQQTGVGGSS